MNRRTEENLIKLAYGEVLPAEAAALEAELKADPAAARELATYRRVKADMPRLNEVPEMQFSADRLREAILQGGLKKRNRFAALSWVLAPMAAAALAVVLFINRPASEQSLPVQPVAENNQKSLTIDTVAINTRPTKNILIPETEQSDPDHAVQTDVSFGTGTEEVPAPAIEPEVNRSSSSSRHVSRVRNQITPIEMQPSAAKEFAVNVTPPVGVPPVDSSASPAPVDDASPSAKPEQKVVVVGDSKDANTGASKATEVGTSSNVRVGG